MSYQTVAMKLCAPEAVIADIWLEKLQLCQRGKSELGRFLRYGEQPPGNLAHLLLGQPVDELDTMSLIHATIGAFSIAGTRRYIDFDIFGLIIICLLHRPLSSRLVLSLSLRWL